MNNINCCYEPIDMKPLYKTILQSMEKKDQYLSAHINVFDDLPDGKNVIHGKSDNGYDLIMLKKDTPQKMLGRVTAEIGKIGNRNLPQIGVSEKSPILFDGTATSDFSAYKLNNSTIYYLQDMLIFVSELLHVNCPQVVFAPELDSAGKFESDDSNNIIYLILNPNHDILYFAVHELRHAWQRKNHPELFDNYMELQECREKYGIHNLVYNSQIAEFDANVIAHTLRKFRLTNPESYFRDWEQTPLNVAYQKAVNCYSLLHNGRFDIDRIIDYKTIYPDLIF